MRLHSSGLKPPPDRAHAICAAWSRTKMRLAKSHRITVLSALPVARVCPSGANATEYTQPVWPVSGWPEPVRPGRVPHVPQDHRAVVAAGGQGVPVRGERHRRTASVWPVRGCPSRWGRAGSGTSHRITVWSSLAVARVCPSGANATDAHGVGVAGQGWPEPLGPGRVPHIPQDHRTGRRCRWPGCARPGRTPPSTRRRCGRSAGRPSRLRAGSGPAHPTGSPSVVAAGGQGAPVRGERHRVHGAGVAGQRVARAAGAGSGPAHPTRSPTVVAAGGQGVPVRGERHRRHASRCGRSAGGPSGCGRVGSRTSHKITVSSSLPVARVCPSGANATDAHGVGVAGQRVADGCGRAGSPTSHKITVLSPLPVARVCPSGANATEHTAPVWPVSGWPEPAGAGSGRAHPTTSPCCRRCRWPGCARPGRTPPTSTEPVWPVSGSPEPLRPGRVAHIPQDHRLVVAAGGQGVPVRGERHRAHGVGVAGQRVARAAAAGSGPRTSHRSTVLVVAAGGQGVPVRGERHRRTRRRCGRSAGRPSRLGPGRVAAHPTRSPTCRRCRWPGCARPGRTPPSTRRRCGRSAGRPSRWGRAGSPTSHRSTVLSSLAVARVCPSGANATAYTAPVWPVRGRPEPAAAGSGPAHPTGSPCCRRWRWPGCARPGRTPPRSRRRCGRSRVPE